MPTPDREPPTDPRPADEAGRLAAVRRYRILDSAPEATFDRFARIAQRLFDAPIGLVAIVGDTRQAFKARHGLDLPGTDRRVGFTAHAIAADATLVVPDAAADPRFALDPLVTGEAGVRFYVGAPLRTTDGHVLGTLCVMDTRPRPAPSASDLALLEELADATMDAIEWRLDRLRRRACYDVLTGLPNRAFLHERLRHEMERARRDGHALGVLMLDLDDWGAVNDAYGHEAGDALLHAVAGRLAWVVRSDETVARLGGDEFVVVVRGAEAARRVAERILVAFATPFEVAGDQRIVRPSIGLARWPEDGEGAEAVLAAADSAMVRAKRSGRHGLRVYGDEAEEAR